jgi:hypothetical protein
VNISVRIAAPTNDGLRAIAVAVRKTIVEYMQASAQRIEAGTPATNDELRPWDYQFSFSDVAADINKPPHNMMLYYQCTTPNEIFLNYDTEEE